MDLSKPVRSIMTTTLHTIGPEQTLQAIKDIFYYYNIHHIPVLENNRLIGMVSNLDYVHALNPAKTKDEEQRNNADILKNMRVKEIMTKNVIVASPEDTIMTILELFNKNVYHAIPIMEKNKLVGIVSTQDIIYTLLNPSSGVRHIISFQA